MSPTTVCDLDVAGDAATLAVDDVGHRRVAEPTEAEAEVERGAEHDDEIGALLQQPAGAQERQLVVGGQRAAAEAVEEARHAQVLDGSAQARPPRSVPVHVAADDERRPLGVGDQRGQLGDGLRIGRRADGRRRRRPPALAPIDGPNTSSGKSRNVGPRWGVSARLAAAWTVSCRRGRVLHRGGRLGDRRTTGTWSISCSEPDPQRISGARPPMHDQRRTVEPRAVVIADTPLVMPGPAVSAARPGRRVSLAHASAANVAVCSWRVSTTRMP